MADTFDIERDERIAREDPLADVFTQKLARVISRNAQSSLGQIVGSKREECAFLSDFTGHKRGPRQFDHRPDQIGQRAALLGEHRRCGPVNQRLQDRQFLGSRDQRDHHFGHRRFTASRRDVAGCFKDRPDLHFVDFGERDPKAATAMPQHRVEFVQFGGAALQRIDANPDGFGQLGKFGIGVRQKFVERWIE